MRLFLSVSLILISLVCLAPAQPESVHAQTWGASDLINTVNEMRASFGLPPYQVDGALMAIAQEHSDYMATIGVFTHTRKDGSSPADDGITAENIGGGLNASPQYVVYTQWADDLHTNTVVGYTEGLVGAGVAVKDGVVYYTLDVKNTGKTTNYRQTQLPGSSGSASPQPTLAPVNPMQTATPAEDGSIIHVIQPGQTLWNVAIAYGVKILDLAALNPGISVEKPIVYPGQKIVVRLAFTPTPSLIPSQTPLPPTKTPKFTFTPRPTRTMTIEPTATPPPLLPRIPSLGSEDSRALGIAVVAISVLGLLAILITTLRGGQKPGA
ncbi:MAG: LysM peptidoglycan-binding domain-containing protein [Anaerolineae bacterium]|nr:LysM peptidoglycan-binding domain-containing protein [Anaerolineae bacterium]